MKSKVIFLFGLFFLSNFHNLKAQPDYFIEKGDYNVLLMANSKKAGLDERKISIEKRAKEEGLDIKVQICSEKKYFPLDAYEARAIGEKVNANLVIWLQGKILRFTQVNYKEEAKGEQGTLPYSENCLIASVFSNFYYVEGQYKEALNSLKLLEECSDTVFSAQWMLANAYYEIRDTANSVKHTSKLLKLNKYSGIAWNLMGILNAEQGNFTEARNCFYEARISSPKNPMYLKNLGLTCYMMEKWDYAFVHFKELSEVWKDSVEILFMAGMSASHLGGFEESSIWFEKVLALNDTSQITHFNQAHNMHMMGKLDQAIFHYSKVTELNEKHANAHLGLAYIYSELKKKDETLKYYNKAIQLNPDIRDIKFEEEFDLK